MVRQKLASREYRQNALRMTLIASDSVVRAYNDVMQYAFQSQSQPARPGSEMAALLGRFLLELRRSMGNDTTKLDDWAMLEWFLGDARKLCRSVKAD
jgi:hypothetical protein